jgi:phospholipase C
MQENRSFDHYFGTLPGVRGFSDPDAMTLSTGKSVFYQPDADNPDGYTLPFHLDTNTTSAQSIPSTSHAWAVQHSAWNNGAMDNWLPAHRAADGANGPYTMGYYEQQTSRSSSRSRRTSPSWTTTTARCSARPGRTGCT